MVEAYCDGHGNANEQHEDAEIDVHGARLVLEFTVQSHGDSASHAKGHHHAEHAHAQCNLPVVYQEAQIHLQTDNEQEQREPEVGDECELRHGLGGEDGFLESRYAAHDRGPEQDASDDLGDDARLADLGERPLQDSAEDDDDAGLRCGGLARCWTDMAMLTRRWGGGRVPG